MTAVLTAQEPSAKYLVNLQPPLVRHFDLIAQAPGGVARLRELILTLAVQGKLVPQDTSDEPASELLKKIRAEKDRLIAEGKIKRDKPLAEITDEEKPFELPATWSWCKGREIFNVIRGVTYQKTDARESFIEDHLPLLRANNIQETINLDDLVYVPRQLVSDDQCLRKGDYLVCLASGSKKLVGKAAPFASDVACSFGAFCGVIRPVSEMGFLAIYLSSLLYRDTVSAASAGIGINNLKGSSLLGLDIPLPPLAEQSRIVARVEELMQLCDALEASGQLEAQQHAQLVGTLLGTLTQSETPEVLADNWQRIATHFDVLLDRPEAVDALEQTILQLAVRGLLVPQDPTDEPASVLLQKIRTEKDHLITQGKIKRDKPLPLITEGDPSVALPSGWELVNVATVFDTTSGTTFDIGMEKEAGAYMYVKVGDMNLPGNEFEITTSSRFIDPDKKTAKALIPSGSIIFPKRGGAIATNKKRIVCTPIFVDLNTMAITPVLVLTAYAFLWLTTIDLASLNTGTSVPQINHKDIDPLPFPLAPLSEQSRIVNRVNELRSLCADLRQRLTAGQAVQSQLANALVMG